MLADETGRLSGGYRAPLITANVLLAGLLKCGAHPSLSVDGRFPGGEPGFISSLYDLPWACTATSESGSSLPLRLPLSRSRLSYLSVGESSGTTPLS
jgi:hypothetical protein